MVEGDEDHTHPNPNRTYYYETYRPTSFDTEQPLPWSLLSTALTKVGTTQEEQ